MLETKKIGGDLYKHAKEELCKELKECLIKSNFGDYLMINHPLVHEPLYIEAANAHYNRSLLVKKKTLEEFYAEEKYGSWVFLHEKPYRLKAFDDLEDQLDSDGIVLNDRTRWNLLRSIWTNSENIWQNLDRWCEHFEQENRNTIRLGMESEDLEAFHNLPPRITIYRGTQKGKNPGLSYTLNKGKAQWFAERFDNEPLVIERIVEKEDCLWYLSNRGEDEIVIDPTIR